MSVSNGSRGLGLVGHGWEPVFSRLVLSKMTRALLTVPNVNTLKAMGLVGGCGHNLPKKYKTETLLVRS